MTKEEFIRILTEGRKKGPSNKKHGQIIETIRRIAESEGYYVNVTKEIELESKGIQVNYIPDLTLEKVETLIIIEVEGREKARKMLGGDIVLSWLAGAEHLIVACADSDTANYVKRCGIIFTDRVKEKREIRVSSILWANIEKELRRLLG